MMEKRGEVKEGVTPCIHCGMPALVILPSGDPVCADHYHEKTAAFNGNDTVDKATESHRGDFE